MNLREIATLADCTVEEVQRALRRGQLIDQEMSSIGLWLRDRFSKVSNRRTRRQLLEDGWRPPERKQRGKFGGKARGKFKRKHTER